VIQISVAHKRLPHCHSLLLSPWLKVLLSSKMPKHKKQKTHHTNHNNQHQQPYSGQHGNAANPVSGSGPASSAHPQLHHHHHHRQRPLSQAEIWDDSALIRAWNDAQAEYDVSLPCSSVTFYLFRRWWCGDRCYYCLVTVAVPFLFGRLFEVYPTLYISAVRLHQYSREGK
jgi:hypothetical protein